MPSIDFNCDMGESFGAWTMGNDAQVMAQISSANIACGFHAGDPQTMQASIALAIKNMVAIGAHPSWPDLLGFGRREMKVSAAETYALVQYQIAALAGMAKVQGAQLHHVKPHGALYNQCAVDKTLAKAVAQAVRDFDPRLILFGLSGSELIAAGEALGLQTAHEVFADRRYQRDGTLVPRSSDGAVIADPKLAVAQVLQMLHQATVTSLCGENISIKADTVCLHGDKANAAEFAQSLRSALNNAGVSVAAIQSIKE